MIRCAFSWISTAGRESKKHYLVRSPEDPVRLRVQGDYPTQLIAYCAPGITRSRAPHPFTILVKGAGADVELLGLVLVTNVLDFYLSYAIIEYGRFVPASPGP